MLRFGGGGRIDSTRELSDGAKHWSQHGPQAPSLSLPQSRICHPPSPQAQRALREECEVKGETLVPCWIEARQAVTYLTASNLPNRLHGQRRPLLLYTSTPVNLDRVIFPLCPDHLIILLEYNVLRGCLENRRLLTEAFRDKADHKGITVHLGSSHTVNGRDKGGRSGHESDEGDGREWSSTAPTVLPAIDDTAHLARLLPPSLRPTLLQSTVPHAAWIDILPHPVLRDNLILATTSTGEGTTQPSQEFDPDALWTDTVGDLFFETGPSSNNRLTSLPSSSEQVEEVADAVFAGGIVWSPPWDVSGWELSEGFWRKWGWMMEGCAGEILEATNRWRRRRGEEELQIQIGSLSCV
ncbi:hypothetical protein CLAIMM_13993 [Cladophialophora immunda]|nr:hypothetical protein CLAIMM_13993 [Cladophialophora immunda]